MMMIFYDVAPVDFFAFDPIWGLHEKYVLEGREHTSTPLFDIYIKFGFFNDVIITAHITPKIAPTKREQVIKNTGK